MRSRVLSVALLAFAAPTLVANAQEFKRYHFQQPVEMRPDPTRVAVFSAAARGHAIEVAGYFHDPVADQLPLPQWRLLSSDQAELSNAEIARNVAIAAAAGPWAWKGSPRQSRASDSTNNARASVASSSGDP